MSDKHWLAGTCIALVTAVTAIFALKHVPPHRADHKLSTATNWHLFFVKRRSATAASTDMTPTQNYNMEVLLREAVMTVMTMMMI